MSVADTKGWFRARKRPLAIWNERQATAAHESKAPYTVLIGPADAPEVFVEINLGLGFVGVNFLDAQLRNHLAYEFRATEDGRLFLHESVQRTYRDETDAVVQTETHDFGPDGSLRITQTDVSTKTARAREASERVDVARNWERVPDFGDYASIARRER